MARARLTVDVQGAEDVLARLRKVVGTVTATKALSRALMKGAKPIRDGVEAGAPRGATGRLASGTDIVKVNRTLFLEGKGPAVAVIAGEFYGLFHEFGTVHQDAHPFMRPAYDANKDEALRIIRDELAAEIRKAAG